MNKVILMGRLTKDPEVRYNAQGENPITVGWFTLAVNRRFAKKDSNEQTADFLRCIAFGKLGEFAEKYLHQGTKVILEGRIQTGSYINRDGQRVYTTDVVAENIEFAESKTSADQNQNTPTEAAVDSEGFMTVSDDNDDALPFT